MRPTYFAFKLLSRLTGEKLRLECSAPSIHGFMTHDEKLQVHNLLLWDFSGSPVEIESSVEGLPKDMRVRHIVLDAVSGSNDENARLRPSPPSEMKKGDHRLRIQFEPYAVKFWSFE